MLKLELFFVFCFLCDALTCRYAIYYCKMGFSVPYASCMCVVYMELCYAIADSSIKIRFIAAYYPRINNVVGPLLCT